MNWAHLQSFVAVAEHGSLSAAARAVGSSQPTLSRHINVLEDWCGQRLFDRSSEGVTLTQTGSDLLAQASLMADAAAQLGPVSEGRAPQMDGTVRITASQIVATYHLPALLHLFHQQHPNISLEVVATDDSQNLLRREADIALRMYRPTQNDLITKYIGTFELAAYSTQDYIAERVMPQTPQDLLEHDLIGYDRSTLVMDGMNALGLEVTRDFFRFRSDDQVVCWQMVCAGFGIGFNHTRIGDADQRLVKIIGSELVGRLPVWLSAHADLRKIPRVRRVFDFLAKELGKITTRP